MKNLRLFMSGLCEVQQMVQESECVTHATKSGLAEGLENSMICSQTHFGHWRVNLETSFKNSCC